MRHAEDLGRNQEGGCSGRASAELENGRCTGRVSAELE
jgi:hypothetical protein